MPRPNTHLPFFPMSTYYITTPIYYVNDRPHIGSCYTTVLADVAARFHRLFGREVFFLTGTDEHAEKVVLTAREKGVSTRQWADTNAQAFRDAFTRLNVSFDDFIRTSEPRHTSKVEAYIRELLAKGHVYMGEYSGWWDASQEEYLTETVAKEAGYVSPVSGKPLVKRSEKNYFFRLSAFEARLKEHIDRNEDFIRPEARRNEVLGRLREGLSDIPISRAIPADAPADDPSRWGILMPDDPGHRIYVWIDALFNYLSAIDTPERQKFWPAGAHLLAKDILWFHAVIWPALLMALDKPLPRTIYAHAYFVRDGRKMSKSLGNFVDIDTLDAYCARYSRDALRWYYATQGPLFATDADFSHAKFIEVFNADLANGIGNCSSRVGNMIVKYFDSKIPDSKGVSELAGYDWPSIIAQSVSAAIAAADRLDIHAALGEGRSLISKVDAYINATEPFKLAKKIDTEPGARDRLAAILYHCAEAVRAASLIMSPAIPEACARLWQSWNCQIPVAHATQTLHHLCEYAGEHALKPGQAIVKGDALFQRADPAEAAPGSPAPDATK